MVQGDAAWGSVGIYFPSRRQDREVGAFVSPDSPSRPEGSFPSAAALLVAKLKVHRRF